jgi:hypothetical protein
MGGGYITMKRIIPGTGPYIQWGRRWLINRYKYDRIFYDEFNGWGFYDEI